VALVGSCLQICRGRTKDELFSPSRGVCGRKTVEDMQLRLSMAHIILLCSNVHHHFQCVGSDLRLDDINIDCVIFIKQLDPVQKFGFQRH